MRFVTPASLIAITILAHTSSAQDWPQWLGLNRDARVTGFTAPSSWPKTLQQEWKISLGDGVATPALVGDRLYVTTRQEANELVRCLDANTGKEIWQDKYEVAGATGPAQSFAGPRCTPAVADGKVVTFGVRGHLNCYDAASGKVLWRKNDFPGAYPIFFTSASPVIVGGLVIAQVGKRDQGGIVAYDLTTGDKKWEWTDDGPAYSSPALMTIDGKKYVIAMTETQMVALGATDGKLAWETPWKAEQRGPGNYNASTPVVDGQTLVFGGGVRGMRCVKLEKKGDAIVGHEVWSIKDGAVQFNTPVARDGHLFGLTQNSELCCTDLADGKVTWSQAIGGTPPATGGGRPGGPPGKGGDTPKNKDGDPPKGKGGMGKGGRGGRGGGYGSIVDAGSVLFALTPTAELVVYQPDSKSFKELARYKVAETATYAYPVIAGKRIYVKDQDNLTLWTMK